MTASKCSVEEQEFKVGNYTYYNNTESYLDNKRLLSRLSVDNCQEVLAYLKNAIGEASCNYSGDNITNYYGSVMNVANKGDVNFNNTVFDQTSDQRQLTIHGDNQLPAALNAYQQGFYPEASRKFTKLLEEDVEFNVKKEGYFYWVLSKLSNINIYKLSGAEVNEIHEYLGYLENTEYKAIGDILWLLVYFENVAANVPSSSIETQRYEKQQRLCFVLPVKYRQFIERINVFTKSSKNLLNQLTYGTA